MIAKGDNTPDPQTIDVAAVILAAGSSTRMGRNKLLLDLDGESMVRRAARQAVEAGLGPVVVVLGHDAERVREALAGLPRVVPTVNPDHARGPGTSLRIGVEAAGAATAFVLMLADMPFVTTEMLAALVDRYRASGTPLVASRYGDVEAPPHVFGRALFPELLAGEDQRCAKPVVRRHLHEAVVAEWPASLLQDVDVAADYEQVRAQLARV